MLLSAVALLHRQIGRERDLKWLLHRSNRAENNSLQRGSDEGGAPQPD